MTKEQTIKAGKLTKDLTFNEKVWAICARIPKGKVVTYGDIAHKLDTKAYRAVGNALNKNPYSPQVPCHRVIGASGSLTGFARGVAKKKQLLKKEGIPFKSDKIDLAACRYKLR